MVNLSSLTRASDANQTPGAECEECKGPISPRGNERERRASSTVEAACVSLRLLKGYSENEMYATQRRLEHYMRSLLVTGGKVRKDILLSSMRLGKWYLSTEFLLHALLTRHPVMSHLQLQQMDIIPWLRWSAEDTLLLVSGRFNAAFYLC